MSLIYNPISISNIFLFVNPNIVCGSIMASGPNSVTNGFNTIVYGT